MFVNIYNAKSWKAVSSQKWKKEKNFGLETCCSSDEKVVERRVNRKLISAMEVMYKAPKKT